MPPPEKRAGQKRETLAIGAALLTGGKLVSRLATIISIAILARLLTPADYGILALASVLVSFAAVFTDLRISLALIRKTTISDEDFATAFTLSAIRGLIVAGVIALAAFPFAAMVGEPLLTTVLLVLAANPLLASLVNQRFVIFEKDLNFSREVIREIVSGLTGCVTAVALGFLWRDYWALVAGLLATSASSLLLTYVMLPARPQIGLKNWREFISFGGWLAGSQAIDRLYRDADKVVLGIGTDAAQVGKYDRGLRIIQIISGEFMYAVMRTGYAGLASIGHDLARLRAAYYRMQTTVLGIMLPVGVGSGVLAHDLVLVLLGKQWIEAAVVIQIIGPVFAIGMVTSGVESLVMVDGSTRRLFIKSVQAFMIRIPALVIGFWLGGFVGLAWGRALSALAIYAIKLKIGAQILGDSWIKPISLSWRSFVAATLMAGVLLTINLFVMQQAWDFQHALFNLVVKAFIGAIIYVGSLLVLWKLAGMPDGFEREVIGLINAAVKRIRLRLLRAS